MEGFNNPYVDKLVGVPSDPQIEKFWQDQIIDTVENIGSELVKGFEQPKTKRDLEIISFAERAVDDVMRRYGRSKRVEIPIHNIHVLKNGGTEEFTKGRIVNAAASNVQKSLIVDRVESDVKFATLLFHEMVHLKSYTALQVFEGENGKELEKYRTGITSYSRDYTEKHWNSIEEAVVGYLTGVFVDSYLNNTPEFKKEHTGNRGEIEISRQDELRGLNKIVDVIFTKNKHRFSNKEEIFDLFIDAQVNGNLLKVGKLIEDAFGAGSLKKMNPRKIA